MITKERFGTVSLGPDKGRPVYRYTLDAGCGTKLVLSNYGARVCDIILSLPGGDRSVAVGFGDLYSYETDDYFGATVGRVANRVSGARFTLDGKTYTLNENRPSCTLHGGLWGFSNRYWRTTEEDGDEPSAVFRRISLSGEEGFPGTMSVKVRYTLKRDNSVHITYSFISDARTPFNITNHTFFNLDGHGDISGHTLLTDADRYLPTDELQLPTGEIRSVCGTPFDFRTPRKIADALECTDSTDILYGHGIDHCFVFPEGKTGLRKHMTAVSSDKLVSMDVLTDKNAVQIYTGNYMSPDSLPFRNGPKVYRGAFCAETEDYPDAVNRPEFPSIIIEPGREYVSETVYRFNF